MPTLLTPNHDVLKSQILRFLRAKARDGRRPAVSRHLLQKQLQQFLRYEPVLGNARDEVEQKLTRAISALRREVPPKLAQDNGRNSVRLFG
jgi:hypothetical protein